jgi:hypothetical protein
MYTCGAQRSDHLLRGEHEYEEGRALRQGIEIRWKAIAPREQETASSAKRYDVLLLSTRAQSLPGFIPIPPDGAPWHIETTSIHLQHPLGEPAGPDQDELRAAASFIAPDGSIQFVALIGAQGAQEEHE